MVSWQYFDTERREAVQVFFDLVAAQEKYPQDLVWFYKKMFGEEPESDDWIYLGYLIARAEIPVEQPFKADVTLRALRRLGSIEGLAQIIIDNLVGLHYNWYGYIDLLHIEREVGSYDSDVRRVLEHLVDGGVLWVISVPSWMRLSGYEDWERAGPAILSVTSSEAEAEGYLRIFNENLIENLLDAGSVEEHEVEDLDIGELPREWDTSLLRLSDDWANFWFDTDLVDFIEEKAPHLLGTEAEDEDEEDAGEEG